MKLPLVLVCALAAVEAQWMQLSPSGAGPARSRHGFAWSDAADGLYMFGGANSSNMLALNVFWLYRRQAQTWTELSPSGAGPAARINFGFAWSDAADGVYLFGGYDGSASLEDLWLYSRQAQTWTQLSPPGTRPRGRRGHGFAWSDAADGLYMLGGQNSGDVYLNALWLYRRQAQTWTQLSSSGTGPAARTNHGFTSSDAADGVYLFGGYDGSASLDDLWLYSRQAQTWTQLSPSGARPSARNSPRIAWSDAADGLYMFGGRSGFDFLNDLWLYSRQAQTWTQLSLGAASPSGRWLHALAWSGFSDGLYLFGGLDDQYGSSALNDFWLYSQVTSTSRTATFTSTSAFSEGYNLGGYGDNSLADLNGVMLDTTLAATAESLPVGVIVLCVVVLGALLLACVVAVRRWRKAPSSPSPGVPADSHMQSTFGRAADFPDEESSPTSPDCNPFDGIATRPKGTPAEGIANTMEDQENHKRPPADADTAASHHGSEGQKRTAEGTTTTSEVYQQPGVKPVAKTEAEVRTAAPRPVPAAKAEMRISKEPPLPPPPVPPPPVVDEVTTVKEQENHKRPPADADTAASHHGSEGEKRTAEGPKIKIEAQGGHGSLPAAQGGHLRQAAGADTAASHHGSEGAAHSELAKKHIFLSGRFNDDWKMKYFKTVRDSLSAKGAPVFMVDVSAGESFAEPTMEGLFFAALMVAFCTDDYGAKTGAGFETYEELKRAHRQKIPILPVQMCKLFPPVPEGNVAGIMQNTYVFGGDLVRLVDIGAKEPERVAEEILKAWQDKFDPEQKTVEI